MFKTKKYHILFLIPVLMLFLAMPSTGCSPHRKGSVMKGKSNIKKVDLEKVVDTILNKGLTQGVDLYVKYKNK